MPKRRTTSTWKDWAVYIIVSVAVVTLWFYSGQYIDSHIGTTDPKLQTAEASRGQFGDKFGAINALFSGLAFAGIIFTIYLQRRELSLQREDIEEQNETARHQRFENSFFHLLELHADIVDKLNVIAHERREAFSYFIELLKQSKELVAFQPLSRLPPQEVHDLRATNILTEGMQARLEPGEITTLKEVLQKNPGAIGQYLDSGHLFHMSLVNAAYAKAHAKSNNGLSHYFRNLYHVYRFLEESKLIDEEEKKKYARIIRAQLSDDELVCILYNSLATHAGGIEFGFPKMTRYVRKYDVLQNLNPASALHPIHLQLIAEVPLKGQA